VRLTLIALSLAAFSLCQLAAVAASDSAGPAGTRADAQGGPTIKFLRPIKGENFFDFPIFIQVQVTGFRLIPPDIRPADKTTADSGHICYSLDDYPVYATEDTQILIGKFLGPRYLPVGWHVLKAELVDKNDRPLSPAVLAVTSVFTGHNAPEESAHVEKGVPEAEQVTEELHKMRTHLEEIKRGLQRIETGNAGFVLDPAAAEGQTAE
jgi:hypothetical protein